MIDSTLPRGAQAPTISNFRAYSKNTLRGQFDITFPDGLIVRQCALHEEDSRYWVTLPGKKYFASDGTARWAGILAFCDYDVKAAFDAAVVPLAVDALRRSKS